MSEKTPALDPDLQAAIAHDSQLLFAEYSRRVDEYYTEEDQAEDRHEFVKRELAFTAKVLGGITLLAQRHSGKVAALFDVDETLAKNRYLGGNDYFTITRPSLPHLFGAINEQLGDQVEAGLLTSRAQIHVDQEAQEPTYTKSAVHLINPDFMISSRDGSIIKPDDKEARYAIEMATLGYGGYEMQYDAVSSLLNPQEFSRTQEVYSNWFDPKLIVLKHLVESHPDYAFAHTDDLPFVTSIDPDNPRLKGIHLDSESYFTI